MDNRKTTRAASIGDQSGEAASKEEEAS